MPRNLYTRRKNVRLREYDYNSPGAYLITICASRRKQPVFGTLKTGKIELSDIGRIIDSCWLTIPNHFRGVNLDQRIVMPDHFHGILLFESEYAGEACLAPTTTSGHNGLPELGTVVGSFKSAVTKRVRKIDSSSKAVWQRGFYEHVIRNQADLERIRDYIVLNPLKLLYQQESKEGF